MKRKNAPIIALDTYRELHRERHPSTGRIQYQRARVSRRSDRHHDLFASRPEEAPTLQQAPPLAKAPPLATPLTDAIHSAARNENTTIFRLPHLARQTLQGTGPVQPVNLEQASAEVELDRFAAPLPPTPLLVPGVGAKKGGLLVPVVIGVASIVLVAAVSIVIAVSLREPSPTPEVAQAAIPARVDSKRTYKKVKKKTAATSSQKMAAALADTANAAILEAAEPRTPKVQPGPEAVSKDRSVREKKKKKRVKRGSKARARKARARRARARARKARARRARARRARRRALAARRLKHRRARRRRAAARRRRTDDVDSLLAGATRKRRSTKVAMASSLPRSLDRPQVQAAMRGIRGQVSRCYHRYKVPGLARVQIKIHPSGKVASARIKGIFAGTPTGACIQAAVKRARFSRFSGPAMKIVYPFVLR